MLLDSVGSYIGKPPVKEFGVENNQCETRFVAYAATNWKEESTLWIWRVESNVLDLQVDGKDEQ